MKNSYRWLVTALLVWIVSIEFTASRHLSTTYDEPRHYLYGSQLLGGDATRFDDSKMPFSVLNALSARAVARVTGGPLGTEDEQIAAGRYATMLFSLIAAWCVLRWSSDLYGRAGALLALTLFAFEPSLLAHSQLVTTDIYAVGTMSWALYAFWRFLRDGGRRWSLASAALIAVAQIAKYTAIFLYPLCAVLAAGYHANRLRHLWRHRDSVSLRAAAATTVRFTALTAVLSLVTINAGFLFQRTMTPLAGYTFRSELFRGLQQKAGDLGRLPIPLPYPYLEGLDWIVQRERTGEGYGNIYLFGEVRQARGFAGYYLVAMLFKVPLVTLVVWLAALGSLAWRRGPPVPWRDEWVVVCPLLFFTVYFNLLYRAQIGLRFFLIAFPLLCVLSGRLVWYWPAASRAWRLAVAGAGTYLLVSLLSYYPHFIPYFNELVRDRKLAYRILADSNLDWRQHLWYLERYLASHPRAIIEPDGPTAGEIIVGANSLTGVAGQPEKFRWLRDNFTPVDHVAYSTLVYRVTPADLLLLGLLPLPPPQ